MARLELAVAVPSTNLEAANDTGFLSTTGEPVADSTTIKVGRDDLKTAVNHGTGQIWNTETLPLGSTINDVRLEVLPSASDSGAFTLKVDVLAPNQRLNIVDAMTHSYGLDMRTFDTPFPPVYIDTDPVVTSDFVVEREMSVGYGMGNISQAWLCSKSGPCKGFNIRMWRSGTIGVGATLQPLLWEACGSGGEWKKDTLVPNQAGVVVDADATLSEVASTNEQFLLGDVSDLSTFPNVVAGRTYINEVDIVGAGSAGLIRFDADGSPPDTNHNATVYGRKFTGTTDRDLEGWGHYTMWENGSDINTAATSGTQDSIAAPTFTSGALHTFGANGGAFAFDTELPNLKASVQAWSDARETRYDRLAITFKDFDGATDDRFRTYNGAASGTATRDGLKGMILTIDYTAPVAVIATNNTATAIQGPERAKDIAISVAEDGILTYSLDGGTATLDTAETILEIGSWQTVNSYCDERDSLRVAMRFVVPGSYYNDNGGMLAPPSFNAAATLSIMSTGEFHNNPKCTVLMNASGDLTLTAATYLAATTTSLMIKNSDGIRQPFTLSEGIENIIPLDGTLFNALQTEFWDGNIVLYVVLEDEDEDFVAALDRGRRETRFQFDTPVLNVNVSPFHSGFEDWQAGRGRAVHDHRLGIPALAADLTTDKYLDGTWVQDWDVDPADDDLYITPRPARRDDKGVR